MAASDCSNRFPPELENRDVCQSNNIRVVARIRPMSCEEERRRCRSVIYPILPGGKEFVDEKAAQHRPSSPPPKKSLNPFAFLTPVKKRGKQTPVKQSVKKDASSDPYLGFGETPVARNGLANKGSSLENTNEQPPQGLQIDKRTFNFDAVFGPTVKQKQVYDQAIGDSLSQNIFQGYNATILAYGQTGSGKTHTMGGHNDHELAPKQEKSSKEARNLSMVFDHLSNGASSCTPSEDDGIICRAVEDLFQVKKLKEKSGDVSIHLNYLEIYNDELRDLLVDSSETRSLEIRDSGKEGTIVEDLTVQEVQSVGQVKALMKAAACRRTTGSTRMNKASSRSHAVCTLTVTVKPKRSTKKVRGKLTLVDLAGSERLKQTGVIGVKKKESININKDLFVLGKVISALAERSRQKDSSRRVSTNTHVPYRDSKLTRLLRDSLGGNCFTVMFACVSPADANIEESINTLRYAERARAITNTVTPNVQKAPLSPEQSEAMRRENKLLKAKISELKNRLQSSERQRRALCSNEAVQHPSNERSSTTSEELEESIVRYEKPISSSEGEATDDVRSELQKENESSVETSLLSYELSLIESIEDLRDENAVHDDESTRSFDTLAIDRKEMSYQLQENALELKEKDQALANLTKSLQLKQEEITNSKADYRELALKNLSLTNEIRGLTDRVAEYEKAISDLKEDLVATKAEVLQKNEGMEEKENYFDPVAFPVEESKRHFHGSSEDMNIELASIEGKKQEAEKEKPSKTYETQHLENKLHDAFHKIALLQKSLDISNAENATLRSKLEDKEKRLEALSNELGEERQSKARKEDRVTIVSDERDALRVKCAVLEDENKRLQEEQRKAPTESHASTRKITDLRECVDERSFSNPSEGSTREEFEERGSEGGISDDLTIESEFGCDDSNASDPKAIRDHATKMLCWAEKAIQKGKSSRSIASSVASSTGTDFKPSVQMVPSAQSHAIQLPGRPPRKIEVPGTAEKKRNVIISNLDKVASNTDCCCQSSLFTGNLEHVEFYLPKLGVACTCGKYTQPIKVQDNGNPTALENILRPWQVEFLNSMEIHTAVELVHVHNQRGASLAKSMRKWRKAKKMISVKTNSCGIALHIWARTCKTVVKSIREQRAQGITTPKKPKFLDVSLESDNRSMSTLGHDSAF